MVSMCDALTQNAQCSLAEDYMRSLKTLSRRGIGE